jgi:hypothetical protein
MILDWCGLDLFDILTDLTSKSTTKFVLFWIVLLAVISYFKSTTRRIIQEEQF